MTYYVYVLASQPYGTLYVGVTNDLLRRVYEHREGLADGFTKRHGVKCLVYYEAFDNVELAIRREKSLKRWPRPLEVRADRARQPTVGRPLERPQPLTVATTCNWTSVIRPGARPLPWIPARARVRSLGRDDVLSNRQRSDGSLSEREMCEYRRVKPRDASGPSTYPSTENVLFWLISRRREKVAVSMAWSRCFSLNFIGFASWSPPPST